MGLLPHVAFGDPPEPRPTPAAPAALSGSASPSGRRFRLRDDVLYVVAGEGEGEGLELSKLPLPGRVAQWQATLRWIFVRTVDQGFVAIDGDSSPAPRIVRHEPRAGLVGMELDAGFLHLRFADGYVLHQSLAALTVDFLAELPLAPEPATPVERAVVQGRELSRCPAGDAIRDAGSLSLVMQGSKLWFLKQSHACWHGSLELGSRILRALHHDESAYVVLSAGQLAGIDARNPREPRLRARLATSCTLFEQMWLSGSPLHLNVPTQEGAVLVFRLAPGGELQPQGADPYRLCRREQERRNEAAETARQPHNRVAASLLAGAGYSSAFRSHLGEGFLEAQLGLITAGGRFSFSVGPAVHTGATQVGLRFTRITTISLSINTSLSEYVRIGVHGATGFGLIHRATNDKDGILGDFRLGGELRILPFRRQYDFLQILIRPSAWFTFTAGVGFNLLLGVGYAKY